MPKQKPMKWVLPQVVDPGTSRCFKINVPNDIQHIAAFYGAIFLLSKPYAWADDSAHTAKAVGAVWSRIFDELLAGSCDCPIPPTPAGGIEVDFDMSGLRVDCDCNVFVTCCDGTEKQILTSDQVQNIIDGLPPGGLPQPSDNGGEACYNAQMQANGKYLLPTVVNSGDVLELTDAQGAGNDGTLSPWHCPDGNTYFITCLSTGGGTSGGDPLPSVFHMRILYNIDGTFYDAMNGPLTVPGGVTNAQVFLQVNDSTLSDNSGSYSFKVCRTNNSAAPWSHTFDLRLSSLNFVPWNDGGGDRAVYVPGQGFSANSGYKPGRISIIWAAAPNSVPTGGSVTLSAAKADASGPVGIEIGAENQSTTGVGPIFAIPGYSTGGVGILVDCSENSSNPSVPAFSAYLTIVTLTGVGVDPF